MAKNEQRVWKVRLFSGPSLERYSSQSCPEDDLTASESSQVRFRSSRVAALLAYLAINLNRYCNREELIDAIWPDETDIAMLKNRLRVTLSSLRQQLESDGLPFDSVLDTSLAGCIRLRASAVWCDLTEFESAYAAGNLELAAKILTGPILPSLHEEWAVELKSRFELMSVEFEPQGKGSGSDGRPNDAPNVNHFLPHFFTTYVPIDGLNERLADLLHGNRLVTIVGTGGIGKTRLSIEVCRSSHTPSVFVSLANSADPNSAFEAILRQLGVGSQTRMSAKQQIETVLKSSGPLRLILDNTEQLLDVDSEWVEFLLSLNEQVSLLFTSRRIVNIQGECVFQLEPMSRPETGGELGDFPATRLFIDRVRLSRPDFRLLPNNFDDIIAICNLVEGLPLGIELASAQISTRSIPEIRQIVQTNIFALKSKHRGISQKHRSLEAVVQSSFDRQAPELLEFLGRLSVFRNSFTIEQAEQIFGDSAAEEKISELVHNSLIGSVLERDQVRFNILEFVRRLAYDRLTEQAQEEAYQTYSEYFLNLASMVQEIDLTTLENLDAEEANLYHVITRANTEREEFWSACRGLLTRCFIRGHHRTGLEMVQRYFPSLDNCQDLATKRMWLVAALHFVPDIGTSEEFSQILLRLDQLANQNGDIIGSAYAMIFRGELAGSNGDFDSRVALHRQALDVAQSTADVELQEVAICHLSGSLHSLAIQATSPAKIKLDLLVEAEQLAARLMHQVSDRSRRHPLSRLLLAVALYYQDRTEEAMNWFDAARQSAERLQIVTVLMFCSFFEREIAESKGDMVCSAEMNREYLRLRRQIGITLPANFAKGL